MFNLSYISYGLFVLIFIGIILVGWKRGFKASLYIFALILVSIGIIIGVSYSNLFDKIASWLAKFIQKKFNGNDSFDFHFLAEAARPQITSIMIAIGILPISLVLFGISFQLYIYVKKFDKPKTLKLISNNLKLIKPKNAKLNKALALTTTSVTALLTSSIIATSTAPLLVTTANFNPFFQTVSALSTASTFGFAYDNKSLHRMYDFIPLTNEDRLMTIFSKLVAPSALMTSQEINELLNLPTFQELISFIRDSEYSAIISVVTSRDSNEIDRVGENSNLPVQWIQNQWRPLGNEGSTNYNLDLTSLQSAYQNIHLGLDETIVKNILDWIRNHGIQNFDRTFAYTNWRDRNIYLNNLYTMLNQNKIRLQQKENEVANFSYKKTLEISHLDNLLNELNSSIRSFNELNKSGGLIAKKRSDIVGPQNEERQKKLDYDKAQNDLVPVQNQYDSYISQGNNLQSNIATQTSERDAKKQRVNVLGDDSKGIIGSSKKDLDLAIDSGNQAAIDSARRTYNNYIQEKNNLSREIDQLRTSIDTSRNNLVLVNGLITNLKPSLDILKDSFNRAKNAWEAANNKLQSLQSELNNLISQKNSLNSKINNYANMEIPQTQRNIKDFETKIKALQWESASFTYSGKMVNNLSNYTSVLRDGATFAEANFVTRTETINLSSYGYNNSIPYLNNENGSKANLIMPSNIPHDFANNDDFKVKDLNANISFGEEGLIQRIEFNIQNAISTLKLLEDFKNRKKIEFDENVEKYINLVEEYLK